MNQGYQTLEYSDADWQAAPDVYLNRDGDNVISMVLECPGFFEEIMSGYRRGYLYNLMAQPSYVSKTVKLALTK